MDESRLQDCWCSVSNRGPELIMGPHPGGLIHPREPTTPCGKEVALQSTGYVSAADGPPKNEWALPMCLLLVFPCLQTQSITRSIRKHRLSFPRMRFVSKSPTHFHCDQPWGWERHLLLVGGNTCFPRSFRRHWKSSGIKAISFSWGHIVHNENSFLLLAFVWTVFLYYGMSSALLRKLSKSRHPSQPGAPPTGVRPSWSNSDGFSLSPATD